MWQGPYKRGTTIILIEISRKITERCFSSIIYFNHEKRYRYFSYLTNFGILFSLSTTKILQLVIGLNFIFSIKYIKNITIFCFFFVFSHSMSTSAMNMVASSHCGGKLLLSVAVSVSWRQQQSGTCHIYDQMSLKHPGACTLPV